MSLEDEDAFFEKYGIFIFVITIASFVTGMTLISMHNIDNEKRTLAYTKTANCGYIDSVFHNMLNDYGLRGLSVEERDEYFGDYYNRYGDDPRYQTTHMELIRQYYTRCHPGDVLDRSINTNWNGQIQIHEERDKVVVVIEKND